MARNIVVDESRVENMVSHTLIFNLESENIKLKKIYSADVVYEVAYIKKNFWGKEIEYEGIVTVPVGQYFLAFSKDNARNMVVYSNMWSEELAKKIMWRSQRVRDFRVLRKYVRVQEIKNANKKTLSKNMSSEDFTEWCSQRGTHA